MVRLGARPRAFIDSTEVFVVRRHYYAPTFTAQWIPTSDPIELKGHKISWIKILMEFSHDTLMKKVGLSVYA